MTDITEQTDNQDIISLANYEDTPEAVVETSTETTLCQSNENNITVQKFLTIYDILDSDTSSLNEEEIKQDSKCTIVFDILMTALFFILYLTDIYSDISLAAYFYLNKQRSTAIVMIYIVYQSSLMTTLFERRTRNKKRCTYYLSAILIFTFNLSGILLYKDILKIQLKKLGHVRKNLAIDPVVNELLIKTKRYLAFVKVIESYAEAFPQMFFQIFAVVNSVNKNEPITILQYITFVTSFIGFSSTAVAFVNSVTPDKPELTIFAKICKYLWLLFVSIGKLTSIYLLAYIDYSFIGYLMLFSMHVSIGRYVYKDSESNIMNGEKPIMRKDLVTTTVFGIVFTVSPYLHTGRKDYYAVDTLTLGHVLHFIEILFITIIWAWYQKQLKETLPFLYNFFIVISVGGFIIGLLFFFMLKYLIKKPAKPGISIYNDRNRLIIA